MTAPDPDLVARSRRLQLATTAQHTAASLTELVEAIADARVVMRRHPALAAFVEAQRYLRLAQTYVGCEIENERRRT